MENTTNGSPNLTTRQVEKIVEKQFNRRLREITGLKGKLSIIKIASPAHKALTRLRHDSKP